MGLSRPEHWSGLHFLLQGLFPSQGLDTHLLEKRASEDEMAGWHRRCNGFELGKTAGDSEDREAWRAAVHGVTKSRTRLGG